MCWEGEGRGEYGHHLRHMLVCRRRKKIVFLTVVRPTIRPAISINIISAHGAKSYASRCQQISNTDPSRGGPISSPPKPCTSYQYNTVQYPQKMPHFSYYVCTVLYANLLAQDIAGKRFPFGFMQSSLPMFGRCGVNSRSNGPRQHVGDGHVRQSCLSIQA